MPTPTVIQVTQLNGNGLLLSTPDLVYATDNGSGSTITQENNQTNPRPIQVTESLNDIIALDDAFLTVNVIRPFVGTAVLSGFRCKTVDDLTDFRRISYEGVGMVNMQFDVSDTISEIQEAINTSSSSTGVFQKISSIQNFDLASPAAFYDIPYESGKDGINVAQYFYILKKSNNTDVYGGDGSETFFLRDAKGNFAFIFGPVVATLVYNSIGATSTIANISYLDVTTEKYQIQVDVPILGGSFMVDLEVWALKSE